MEYKAQMFALNLQNKEKYIETLQNQIAKAGKQLEREKAKRIEAESDL